MKFFTIIIFQKKYQNYILENDYSVIRKMRFFLTIDKNFSLPKSDGVKDFFFRGTFCGVRGVHR
jgi:hypothetical protein